MHRPIAMAAVALPCVLTCQATTHAQLAVSLGDLAVGALLDKEINHVGGLINSAANAGNTVLAGASGQVLQALLAAKQAYADSLDMTTEQLKATQRSLLDDLVSKVQTLEKGTMAQVREIADKGALIGNQFPFSDKFPQVIRYGPYYVATTENGKHVIDVWGNFFDVARRVMPPP